MKINEFFVILDFTRRFQNSKPGLQDDEGYYSLYAIGGSTLDFEHWFWVESHYRL